MYLCYDNKNHSHTLYSFPLTHYLLKCLIGMERTIPYFKNIILEPNIAQGKNVLITSHVRKKKKKFNKKLKKKLYQNK